MSTWPVLVPVIAAVWVTWMALVIWLTLNRYNARSPKGIAERLTEKGGSYTVSATYTRGVWNPAKPIGIDNPLHDKGVATYSLDDSGTVRLDFKAASGHDQHLSGPLPESLVHPTVHQQHTRALMRRVLLAYLSFLLLGTAIGAAVPSGDLADHIVGGGLGFVAAMGVALILVRFFRVGKALRDVTKR